MSQSSGQGSLPRLSYSRSLVRVVTGPWSRSGFRPGARASELLGATVADVDPGQQLITVIRKETRAMQPLPEVPRLHTRHRRHRRRLTPIVRRETIRRAYGTTTWRRSAISAGGALTLSLATSASTIAMHWSGRVDGLAPTVPQISLGMYSGACSVVTVQDGTRPPARRRCAPRSDPRWGYSPLAGESRAIRP
jgi:hypothetical protein